MKHLHIVVASTRKGRVGAGIANWALQLIEAQKDLSVEIVDLLDFPLPLLDSDISPVSEKTAVELIHNWSAKVAEADGYIFVSPEYNHGYSGALKNALDTLKKEWEWKPVAIVGYGGIAGGARSMEQLRLVLIELKMRPTYASVLLPFVWEALDANGAPTHKGAQTQLEGVVEELKQLLAN